MEKSKTYGLTFPSKKVEEPTKKLIESVFNNDSDGETSTKQLTKSDLDKAIEDDPSIFEYDEVYDEISSEQRSRVEDLFGGQKSDQRQSKYVQKLMKAACDRKLERDLCAERKAKKEVDADSDAHAGKEAFVTSAYKAKLNEMNAFMAKRDEDNKREAYMDVTKQDGLGGFYRYMFQHQTNDSGCGDSKQPIDDNPHGNNQPTVDRDPGCYGIPERGHYSNRPDAPDHDSPSRESTQSSSRKNFGQAPNTSRHIYQRVTQNYGASSATCTNEAKKETDQLTVPTSDHHFKSNKPTESSEDKNLRSLHGTDLSEKVKIHREGETGAKTERKADNDGSTSRKLPRDPNFVRAHPRRTTDDEVDAARERFESRKAAGIHPLIADSDSE